MGTEKPDPLKRFSESLKEIGGYVAAILFYILALTGYVPPPLPQSYSSTVSTLTILVSMTALWLWRFPRIAAKRPAESSGILVAGSKHPPESSVRDSFLLPFRSDSRRSYNMPLAQRRLEGALLFSLTAFAIGVTGARLPSIAGEIGGLRCLKTVSDAPRILIADFSPPNTNQFGDSLANYMSVKMETQLEVCRYYRPFTLVDKARDTGARHGAELVVWGNDNDGLLDVYLTPTAPEWDISDPLKDGLSVRDSNKEVALLAEQIAAEILFFQGQPAKARENLSRALESAEEAQDLRSANPGLLADGRFLLGLLFDPNQYPEGSDVADLGRAIAEYSKAVRLNETLEVAYLNRAALYTLSGDTEKAIADYARVILIADNSNDLFDAHLQKAELQLGKGMCSDVIADLETALQSPDAEGYYLYSYLVHNLGKAHLMCGNYNAAEDAYRNILQLEAEYAFLFAEELNALVSERPGNQALEEEVNNIVEYLEQVSHP
ncbi:MAG: hypothetical protein L6Q26_02120 [Anaerolineales bacterium]|nr:hypothetical protein [Anaerolineales bacterium]